MEGDPFEVGDTETMLNEVAPNAKGQPDVVLVGRDGCPHCARPCLEQKGWPFDEVPSNPRRLRGLSGKQTTPQIFIDGKYIGGADELETYLKAL